MNPYEPPETMRTTVRLTVLQWAGAIVSGALSVLAIMAIISNFLIFWGLSRWPSTLWQWCGVALMAFAMFLFAIGMGWTSWGILFDNRRRRRIGMFCSGASVLVYIVCVAFAITMRILYPDPLPFGR